MEANSRCVRPIDFDGNFYRYYTDVSHTEILDPETERKLFLRYKRKKDIDARDRLLGSCLRFVVTLAKKYSKDVDTLKELVSAGNLGLMIALDRYDHRRGTRFLSYATYWVLLYIRNELYNNKLVAMPLWRQKAVRKLKRAKRRNEAENGCEPSMDELSKELDLSETQLERLRVEQFHYTELDEDNPTPPDTVDSAVINNQSKYILRDLIKTLSVKEQFIITAYYGLKTDRKSLREIADFLGITSERVRQIKMEALRRLRRYLTNGLHLHEVEQMMA